MGQKHIDKIKYKYDFLTEIDPTPELSPSQIQSKRNNTKYV